MGYTDFQKIYGKPEAAFGDGASGDFSGATGCRIWPTERVDLSGCKQRMSDVDWSVGDYTEIGPEGVTTFKDTAFSLPLIFPGASVSSGIVEDEFSKMANYLIGKRYAAGADDAADVGCTATSVVIKGATTYTALKSMVRINGETRLLATWDGPTKTMTFNTPLSAAPSEDDVVYDVESFDTTQAAAAVYSYAFGFEHDDPNADYLIKGAVANIDSVSFVNAETAKITLSIMAQDHEKGAAKVSAVSTNEIQTGEVKPTAGGGYYVKDSAGTDVDNPCTKQAELSAVGIEWSPVECYGAAEGIGAFQKVPSSGMSQLNLTIYEDETPMYAEFVALVGNEREQIVQMGHQAGASVGFIIPTASIGTADGYPEYTNEDRKEFFKTTWRGTPAIFFRG